MKSNGKVCLFTFRYLVDLCRVCTSAFTRNYFDAAKDGTVLLLLEVGSVAYTEKKINN